MEIDESKFDQVALALLYLTLHGGVSVWKTFDWDTMNKLHGLSHAPPIIPRCICVYLLGCARFN